MNRVALITGASRGIGRGIALELAKIGYDLLINYATNLEAAHRCASDCMQEAKKEGRSIRTEIFQADVSSASQRVKLIQFCRRSFGRLDLLVNNAGIAPQVRVDLLETSEESFDRILQINLKGPFFLSQLAAKWMIEQGQAAPEGGVRSVEPKIVMISSLSAYAASVNRAEYCISKAALSMVTSLFASRLAEHGIRVYEIRPGIIETDMTSGVRQKYEQLIQEGITPIKKWGSAQEVGKAVAAIAQDYLPFSTGEVLNVDGGFHLRRL